MINVGISVESYLLSNDSLFQTERFAVKNWSFEKVDYGSYKIWNESKIMSIAKEGESNFGSNNENLEATNVWQRMAKNM